MATEDHLPKELDKLEITHIFPQIKFLDSNLPLELNPFFDTELKDTGGPENRAQKTGEKVKPKNNRIANQNCRRCRLRRASESVLDDLKQSSTDAATDLNEYTRTPTNGVHKQTLKKTISSSGGSLTNRKVLLREPVLKALQTCLHPHSNVRRKLLASAANTKLIANETPLTTKGMSGFRDLIDECRNLLSEDVDFSDRLNKLSLSNRYSKNFTTIQNPKAQNSSKSRNNRRAKFNSCTETISQDDDQLDAQAMPTIHTTLLNSNVSSINIQQRNISILSADQLTNPNRCNTTCSQQAGNSAVATACDDITIDELASYFDTLVHIPKKMSSMAEMMYI